jgi:hypothetical protein
VPPQNLLEQIQGAGIPTLTKSQLFPLTGSRDDVALFAAGVHAGREVAPTRQPPPAESRARPRLRLAARHSHLLVTAQAGYADEHAARRTRPLRSATAQHGLRRRCSLHTGMPKLRKSHCNRGRVGIVQRDVCFRIFRWCKTPSQHLDGIAC